METNISVISFWPHLTAILRRCLTLRKAGPVNSTVPTSTSTYHVWPEGGATSVFKPDILCSRMLMDDVQCPSFDCLPLSPRTLRARGEKIFSCKFECAREVCCTSQHTTKNETLYIQLSDQLEISKPSPKP